MGGGLTPKGIVAKMANSVCLSFWVSTLIWPSFIQIGGMACITPAWSSRELSLNFFTRLMSTLQITRKMASVRDSSDVITNLSDQLGGLVLKEEQKLAIEALLSGKDAMTVLPTGFGKSVICQSFVIAKNFANVNTASIVVVVPLRSIIEDQLQSNDFGLKAVAFEKIPQLLSV